MTANERKQMFSLNGLRKYKGQKILCSGYTPGEVDAGPFAVKRLETAQKKAIILLCLFTGLNPAIAQLGYLFIPEGIAGLSLMQWFQGIVFLLELTLLLCLLRPYPDIRHLQRLVVVSALVIVVFMTKSTMTHGTSTETLKGELMVYFKYFFWIFSWLFVGLSVRRPATARILLIYIVLGAFVDAVFKLVGFATGQWEVATYASAGVSASFGADGISGKATIGFLLPSVTLSWYLLKNRPWYAAATSVAFIAAIVLTYDRTAQLALCLSLSLCAALILFRPSSQKIQSVILRFFILLVACFWIYAVNYGAETLIARWTYELQNTRTITGSGRTDIYATTWRWFKSSDGLDFLLGQGVEGTYEMTHRFHGSRVHTHSDLFDLMSFGGVVGLLLYACIIGTLFHSFLAIPNCSYELIIALPICVGLFVLSLITGQFGAVHAMYTVGTSLWCLQLMANMSTDYPAQRRLLGPPIKYSPSQSMMRL